MFQFKDIDKTVQKTLYDRIRALNRKNGHIGENLNLDPVDQNPQFRGFSMDEMMTKACWARVTCPVFKKDDEGEITDTDFFRISSAFKDGEERNNIHKNEPLAVNEKMNSSKSGFFTTDANAIFRPHSGISSITTSFQGGQGTSQQAVINWKFHDIRKFKEYENALLKVGKMVMVEFGWSKNSGIHLEKQPVDGKEDFINIYRATNEQIKKAGGDYHTMMGKITSFDYKINQNGGFDCTTTIVSLGVDIFKSKVEENSDNVKINDVLLDNTNEKTLEDAYANSNFYFEKFMANLDDNIKEFQEAGYPGVYHDGEKGWCNWGFFEDVVINSFFSWTKKNPNLDANGTNEEQNSNNNPKLLTLMKSRSITYKTEPDDDGLGGGKIVETIAANTQCRSNKNLFTISKDIILPGKVPGLDGINVEGDGDVDSKLTGNVGSLMQTKYAGTEVLSNYIKIYSNFKKIDDGRFPNWAIQTKHGERGVIRNFVFSSDFLHQQFGSGIHNLDSGLNSFWKSVSAQYNNFWDFDLVIDTDNSGKIGMIDKYTTEQRIREKKDNFVPEKKFDLEQTFVFSNYGKDSLMKSFDTSVRLSAEQATMAALHTNKNFSSENIEQTTNTPEDIGVRALSTLLNVQLSGTQVKPNDDSDKDQIMKDISHPASIGKIMKYLPAESDGDSQGKFGMIDAPRFIKSIAGDQSYEESLEEAEMNKIDEESATEFTKAFNWFDENNPANAGMIYTPQGQMIESYKKTMLFLTSKKLKSLKGVDPLVPLEISFSMPGISGIDLFDMFEVDYLPEAYLEFAAFQVKSMEHSIDTSGWTTTITGQMRIDMDTLIDRLGSLPDEKDTEINVITDPNQTIDFIDVTQAKRLRDEKNNSESDEETGPSEEEKKEEKAVINEEMDAQVQELYNEPEPKNSTDSTTTTTTTTTQTDYGTVTKTEEKITNPDGSTVTTTSELTTGEIGGTPIQFSRQREEGYVVWIKLLDKNGKSFDPPKYAQGISQSENPNSARSAAALNARINASKGKTTGKLPQYAR
jgi:hypothetical protein